MERMDVIEKAVEITGQDSGHFDLHKIERIASVLGDTEIPKSANRVVVGFIEVVKGGEPAHDMYILVDPEDVGRFADLVDAIKDDYFDETTIANLMYKAENMEITLYEYLEMAIRGFYYEMPIEKFKEFIDVFAPVFAPSLKDENSANYIYFEQT